MTCSWMAKMALASAFIQATYLRPEAERYLRETFTNIPWYPWRTLPSSDGAVHKVIYVIETFLKWKHREPALKVFKGYWTNIGILQVNKFTVCFENITRKNNKWLKLRDFWQELEKIKKKLMENFVKMQVQKTADWLTKYAKFLNFCFSTNFKINKNLWKCCQVVISNRHH